MVQVVRNKIEQVNSLVKEPLEIENSKEKTFIQDNRKFTYAKEYTNEYYVCPRCKLGGLNFNLYNFCPFCGISKTATETE